MSEGHWVHRLGLPLLHGLRVNAGGLGSGLRGSLWETLRSSGGHSLHVGHSHLSSSDLVGDVGLGSRSSELMHLRRLLHLSLGLSGSTNLVGLVHRSWESLSHHLVGLLHLLSLVLGQIELGKLLLVEFGNQLGHVHVSHEAWLLLMRRESSSLLLLLVRRESS